MARRFLIPIVLLLAVGAASAKSIAIQTQPTDAKIFLVQSSGAKTLLGTGSARLKLDKASPNQVEVTREGFEPLVKEFPADGKYAKQVILRLENRLVKITCLPYDAEVLENGVSVGSSNYEVVIPKNQSVTIEVKKPGFRTESRTYHNSEGMDVPPVTDTIELKDRTVLVTVSPSGAQIIADDVPAGETSAEVTIKQGSCTVVKIAKRGFRPMEKNYCNMPQAPEPPTRDPFTLKDRVVQVRVRPPDADIEVDGQIVARGEFQVIVPPDECIRVRAFKEAFVEERARYCNKLNHPEPPVEVPFELQADEAFATSVRSDQANVKISIEVNPNLTEDDAWRLLSSIVTNYFEVLEMSDKSTGYLRTAWEVMNFKHNTIRTRIIVNMPNVSPLRYAVKIASEYSGESATSVKDDEKFNEWDRILNKYKNLVPEVQDRLR